MLESSRSFTVLHKSSGSRARLICFHHAGGSVAAFRDWGAHLGDKFELVAAQLPGRGRRFCEPLIKDSGTLIAQLRKDLPAWMDKPYVLFGHSMGALLAYEIACQIEAANAQPPLMLATCGRRAPHRPRHDRFYHRLPEAEFMAEVRSLDGTPGDILDSPELVALLSPVIRADFELVETHQHTPRPPLRCPILAIKGTCDHWVPESDARAWRELTLGKFEYRTYDGGHFPLDHHRVQIIDEVVRAYDALEEVAPPVTHNHQQPLGR